MHRRQLLRAAPVAGIGALAGCNVFGGESEAAREAIQAASSDLVDGSDEFATQIEDLGSLSASIGFEDESIREYVSSAREHLDEAEEEATQDETKAEIDSLRSATDYLEGVTDAGTRLSDAHAEGQTGLDQVDAEEWGSAAGTFGTAMGVVEEADSDLEAARTSVDEIDPDVLKNLEVDTEAINEVVSGLGGIHSAYGYQAGALEQFAAGSEQFAEAESSEETEDYDRAERQYRDSRDRYAAMRDAVDGYENDDLDEEVRSIVAGLDEVGRTMAGLAGTLEQLMVLQTAFDAAFTAVDNDRFDTASGHATTADEAATTAGEEFDEARTGLQALSGSETTVYDELDLSSVRDRADEVERTFDALDHVASGLDEYVEGFRLSDEAGTALDEERFGDAADLFSDASPKFSTAESRFRDARSVAPQDLRDGIDGLVCWAGAFAEATGYYAEGSQALADGDSSTADQKFSQGDSALEQCGN